MTLRAWSVTTAYTPVSVIVFAETAAEAKSLSLFTDWLEDERWTDLRVTRQRDADRYAEQFGTIALDMTTAEQQRVARNLGWYQTDFSDASDECARCHRYAWWLVPESVMNEQNLCAGCVAEGGA